MFIKILKKAGPVPQLKDYDNFLFVGPHPDDIEVGCGATVAVLTAMGKKVSFVVVTDGGVGSVNPDIAESQLVEIRRKECMESAKILGVSDVTFLNFKDGNGYDVNDVTRALAECIVRLKPDVVLCPDYTVPSETHPDHINVGKCCTDAMFYAEWRRITDRMGIEGNWPVKVIAYYYTHRPNTYVNVKKTFETKFKAIGCHRSQFTDADINSFRTYFRLRGIRFGLRCGKRNCEGFCALSPTHRHCFPEASEF